MRTYVSFCHAQSVDILQQSLDSVGVEVTEKRFRSDEGIESITQLFVSVCHQNQWRSLYGSVLLCSVCAVMKVLVLCPKNNLSSWRAEAS